MLTELRPNSDLLDPNFSGYKLSLDPIPVYRQNIIEGVDHVCQNEDQYSFIHTKVFSLHNHLFPDPWCESWVYFVDAKWIVWIAKINTDTGRLESPEAVWTVPGLAGRKSGHFNISVHFPSAESAVLADGCGKLHILNRSDHSKWKVEWSGEVEGLTLGDGNVLSSARLRDEQTLHCVLLTLETVTQSGEQSRTHSSVNTLLHWIVFGKGDEGLWTQTSRRTFQGAGSVDYVALEDSCSALYVGSNTTFKFTYDSENPLPPPEEKMEAEAEAPVYSWEQSADDIKVSVALAEEVSRDDLEVRVGKSDMTVVCRQTTLMSGSLFHVVDTDLTTWTLQPGKLELILTKQETGLMWSELIVGDSRGQQMLDPALTAEVHARLSHLTSDTEVKETGNEMAPSFNLDQLEDCDSAPESNCNVVRLDPSTHTVTHQISLAGHQWLTSVVSSDVPHLCVRHDVDGCVWRLDPPALSSSQWPCEHIGTFYALGYVAASKQQRKFIVATPDLSYVAICEASSHVFVYRRSSVVNGELRNRKTAAKVTTVAKQQLINLESQSAVLGAHAYNHYLFILTSDTLFAFHIQ